MLFRYIFVKTDINRGYSGAKPGELHSDVEEDSGETGVKCEQIIIVSKITIIRHHINLQR